MFSPYSNEGLCDNATQRNRRSKTFLSITSVIDFLILLLISWINRDSRRKVRMSLGVVESRRAGRREREKDSEKLEGFSNSWMTDRSHLIIVLFTNNFLSSRRKLRWEYRRLVPIVFMWMLISKFFPALSRVCVEICVNLNMTINFSILTLRRRRRWLREGKLFYIYASSTWNQPGRV